mmetsp:Transcript_73176/g.110366  ORF Transcript_73176/g.110366 Transcript_73176/m.110366 type:complete len:629 (+) Transcript_73176:59-1945(+)
MSFFVSNTKDYLPELFPCDQNENGVITSISGPVVTVSKMFGAKLGEVVNIGSSKLLGEIIELNRESATVQVFEETAGCQIGDVVSKSGNLLSAELGPGIISNVFDGVQRPLERAEKSDDSSDSCIFLKRGNSNFPSPLDRNQFWHFIPSSNFQIGDYVHGGDIIGTVKENQFLEHKIMVPPRESGTIVAISKEFSYTVDDIVYQLECDSGEIKSFTMVQTWPIRSPRPAQTNLEGDTPLFLGLRVIDSLFPAITGGSIALPRSCGGNAIQFSLSKYSNLDFHVIACCEKSNEVGQLLLDYPLIIATTEEGNEGTAMDKSIIIANTSNMPVVGREASIHLAMTIAEYIRDMGYNVSVMADSISRWVEALKEISICLGEIPSESGYPSYLGSRLEKFFGRAGKITCIGTPERNGSVSVFAKLSLTTDFSDPCTASTLNIVQTFWGLDRKIAQKKHFPSVNWVKSFSTVVGTSLGCYLRNFDPEWILLLRQCRKILDDEESIYERVRSHGKESLSELDQFRLECSRIIREDFLQQNIFTEYDQFCPFYKTVWMLKNILLFFNLGENFLLRFGDEDNMTWDSLKKSLAPVIVELSTMKSLNPADGQESLELQYQNLNTAIVNQFAELSAPLS